MSTTEDQLQELQQIRNIMERSSKFISLSGFSGIAAGICALIGAAFAYFYINPAFEAVSEYSSYYELVQRSTKWGMSYHLFLLLDGGFTALFAMLFAVYFSHQKAKKQGLSLNNPSSRRLFFHMSVPLLVGSIFTLAMLYHGSLAYIAPCTLLFYGLALISGSKYTLHQVQYLGAGMLVLGSIGLFWLRHGFELWIVGFGFFHIIYGIWMYYKYDQYTSSK
jgi:hypothetical protein